MQRSDQAWHVAGAARKRMRQRKCERDRGSKWEGKRWGHSKRHHWDKANHSQEGNIYNICLIKDSYLEYKKNSYKSINKKETNHLIFLKKKGKRFEQVTHKEDVQIANKPMKRWSTSLLFRKVKFWGKMKYYYLFQEWVKRLKNSRICKNRKPMKFSFFAGRSVKPCCKTI